MTFIKICGLRDHESVDLAVALGVDAVGFVFADSARQVSAHVADHLARSVPTGMLAVGVFKGNPLGEIIESACGAGFTTVQVHDLQTPDDVATLHAAGLKVIRAVVAGQIRDGYALDLGEDRLLIDGATAGAGVPWDWTNHNAPTGEWILAGGLTPTNVRAALDATGAWGVDVSSGVESSRGIKDLALIEQFVSAVREG